KEKEKEEKAEEGELEEEEDKDEEGMYFGDWETYNNYQNSSMPMPVSRYGAHHAKWKANMHENTSYLPDDVSRKETLRIGALWPDVNGWPTLYYAFDEFANVNRPSVMRGIDHIMEHTCVKFLETTNFKQKYQLFTKGNDNVCQAYIGRYQQITAHKIYIGKTCTSLGVVVHELCHALGLHHEHQRYDRDDHLHINLQNVKDGRDSEFIKQEDVDLSIKFDFTSIMHYSLKVFTKNNKKTIITRNPLDLQLIDRMTSQIKGLTYRDKILINRMYKCTDKWLVQCNRSSDPCENDSYLGANCKCVCSPGTTGKYCSDVVYTDYYAEFRRGYDEIITTSKIISTPEYPIRVTIETTINHFNLVTYENFKV
ncbi:unnamed protein product, partial [Meganyctiphanes norvegica]